MMSDDLIAFLRARLNEVEQVARAATCGPWEVGSSFGGENNRVYVKPEGPGIDTIGTCVIAGQVSNMPQWRANAQHIAHWDPARVLAEVKAKRRLLNLHAPKPMWVSQDACTECSGCGCCPQEHPCPTVQILALPFADHPEYCAEWRPAAE